MKFLPTIAITLGDPLGIGSEIVSKALKDPHLKKKANWVLLGTPYSQKISPLQAGKASHQALSQAVALLKADKVQAVVTAPVSKTHLNKAGFKFPGQTEFLADAFVCKPTMMLAGPRLRVVLTTIHIPLREVVSHITPAKVFEKILTTHAALKKDFGIKRPRIALCGINPHAGENGLFGDEEKKLLKPAIAKAKRLGMQIFGPLPADTIFHEAAKGHFDAVIAHYHDQGLGPLKTLHFDEGVNITLGLPIIRTSPDHGCAFDIAGKNKANPASMKAAMEMAIQIIQNRTKFS